MVGRSTGRSSAGRSAGRSLTQQNTDHFNLKHQGILMTNEMEAKLKDLLGKGERVVFTGHSAGAAVAAYVYKELYRKGESGRAEWGRGRAVSG